MQIDTTSYRKDTIHPQRWGYQARGSAVPSSVIIHTTSNRRATQFNTEATFIRDSPDISAHFLIGKDARIVQFLDPQQWQAWHAGAAIPAYLNARSIGIEHHVSIGESWTDAQHGACTWLVRQLMADYGIPPTLIDTHRAVALPNGRKSDPTGWDDQAFYTWRATLADAPVPPPSHTVIAGPYGAIARTDYRAPAPAAAYFPPGTAIEIDGFFQNGYRHCANGIGFLADGDLVQS